MNRKDVYIYYSTATDITGKKLQEALGIDGGIEEPIGKKLVIGWGTKIKENIDFTKDTKVFNHPNAIKINRNKFEALRIMAEKLNKNGKTVIPEYITSDRIKEAIAINEISFPLIGRTKYHQGGKGFWSCPTVAQLDVAIKAGAHYFQKMIPVKNEYRLHVFNGEIIHAVKKVQRTDKEFEEAWIEDEFNRQKNLAEKNNNPFDDNIAKNILKRQAKNATAGGANIILRSNKMGWKFSIVKKFDECLKEVAVDAVKALGLHFGAVDCCLDIQTNPYIFEVNSGPGLEGTSFEKYVMSFKSLIGDKKIGKDIDFSTVAKAKEIVTETSLTKKSEKSFMKMQLGRLQEMIDIADEDEFDAIKKIGSTLIFGGQ